MTIRPLAMALMLSALFMVAGFFPTTPAIAQDATLEGAGSIMLILDASGSMWGQVENRTKIEIAREALVELIDSLPDSARVGLVAYGHRVKGDCNDVEELVPLAPLDRERLKEQVLALNPKGKTPITWSLQLTAESLEDVEEEVTILLVSDGKETCEGDPCALVRQLRESGVRVVVNVIGFDVTAEEGEQLRCIAEAGGGQYFDAGSVSEFQEAAMSTLEDPRFQRATLSVAAMRNGEPVEAYVTVLNEADGTEARTDFTYPGSPLKLFLEPGTYTVRAVDRNVAGDPEVAVAGIVLESGQVLEQVVDFSSGDLEVQATSSGIPFTALVTIKAPESGATVAQGVTEGPDKTFLFHLPAGEYDIEVVNTDASVMQTQTVRVAVASGQYLEQVVEFGLATLTVDVTQNGVPVKASFWLRPPGTDKTVTSGSSSQDGPMTMEIPAGTYDLEWSYYEDSDRVDHGLFADVAVEAGKTTSLEVAMEHGLLEVSCRKGGQPYDCDVNIYQADEPFSIFASVDISDGQGAIHLPEGVYRVVGRDMEADGYPTSEVEGVAVAPRETTRAEVDF